ncbi:MAG: PAS domain-containing sensor histidine kinase, partial [Acidobacteria bacterium]
MRRRTQIVLAITLMVAAVVSGASYIYIAQILRQGINTTHDNAAFVAAQIAYLATNAAPDLSSTRVDTTNPEALRRGIAYYLGTDRDLNTVLDSVVGSFPTIYDAAVLDSDGKAILDTDPNLIGKKISDRPDFAQLQGAGFRRKLRMIYNPPTIYDVHLPLMLNGQTFGSIHVGVSTIFLRSELTPRLQRQLVLSAIAVLCSLVLAALLSNIALGPLEHINRSLD